MLQKKEVKEKPEEVIESDIESDLDEGNEGFQKEAESSDSDEDKYLTAQEKKVKLAKKYLDELKRHEQEKLQDEDEVEEQVLRKLKDSELEKAGKLKKRIADRVKFDSDSKKVLVCKQHKLSITCIVVSSDSQYLYSASKDHSIVKWSLDSFSKTDFKVFKSSSDNATVHKSVINCLAISFDSKYLASGDEKGNIIVWNPSTLQHVHTFRSAHKTSVTDLVICRGTNYMYSSSRDLLVKAWNLEEHAYMETLFGHQAEVTSVDVINEDRIVSSGGSDKTVRVWKIQEESQLVFNAESGSVEIVRKLDESYFVSCSDDGKLCLWTMLKKKPVYTVCNAHGICAENGQPNWIGALAVLPNSDVFASGSCDGQLRLWRWHRENKTIVSLANVPVSGFVNCLRFTSNGSFLVAGVGKEHRLGRWQCIKEAKNSIVCVPITTINGIN